MSEGRRSAHPEAEGCIFCRILAGEADVSWVSRGPMVAAFMTIGPLNPGHTLVVPVQHYASLAELDPDVGGAMFREGQRIAAAIRASNLHCEGINFIYDDGRAAMQTVFHAHLHVVPRYFGDGIRIVLPPGFSFHRARPELDEAAAEIRAALAQLDRPSQPDSAIGTAAQS